MIMNVIRGIFPISVFSAIDGISSGGVRHETAVFAGGCFWCIEAAFDNVDGVISAVSGYTGGKVPDPSYDEVSTGLTGHYEAVKIIFDPSRISYSSLLDIFWRQIDPTDGGGQFADRGNQYRTAVFFQTDAQHAAVLQSIKELASSGRYDGEIVTGIFPASAFYPAEEYHQKYCRRHPDSYAGYKKGSGRELYIQRMNAGGKEGAKPVTRGFHTPSGDELREKLSPLQYNVTQEGGTECAFDNEFWNEKRRGIYVDVVSGEVLFLSKDKYDSGTGWPSFTKPAAADVVTAVVDGSHSMSRTEVRSRGSNSHLGHLFDDGPAPGFARYCINSAALRFVPEEEMEKEGYGDFLPLREP